MSGIGHLVGRTVVVDKRSVARIGILDTGIGSALGVMGTVAVERRFEIA